MGQADRGPRRGVTAAVLTLCALFAPASPTQGRPLSLDDALQREGLGEVTIAPGERWLLIERRRAYGRAARFDFDLLNSWFRTEVQLVDLDRPGAARPLFRHDPTAGYRLGPVSPDGARVLVFELTDSALRLLSVELATGRVRRLPLAADFDFEGRTAAWISSTRIVAFDLQDGRLPRDVRAMRPWAGLPARWTAQAAGGATVTAYESGARPDAEPRPSPRALVRVNVISGRREELGRGNFVDLEPSPSGRWLALLQAGRAVGLTPDRPPHGGFGVAVQRRRLAVLELATGRLIRPCPDCDMIGTLLAWSPSGETLLTYAREDGQPWTAGRLVKTEAASGRAVSISEGLSLAVSGRPETVRAAWLGDTPIAYGRPTGSSRGDGWRPVDGRAPRELATSSRVLLAGDRLAEADAGGVRLIDPEGAQIRVASGGYVLLQSGTGGLQARLHHRLAPLGSIAGVRRTDGAVNVLGLSGRAAGRRIDLPARAQVLAWSDRHAGAAVLLHEAGARRRLAWKTADGAVTSLALLNERLGRVAAPEVLPVRHGGPGGEALTSWLLLPPRRPSARPPPLVVWIYPGRTYAAPRRNLVDPAGDGPISPPQLLVDAGYAVLAASLPDPRDGRAPAEGLAARVLQIVDAAARAPTAAGRFDPDRLAVAGHSFGGYGTLTVISQTSRFRAAIALAGPSSLFSAWGEFALAHRVDPDEGPGVAAWTQGWVEGVQAGMGAPPWSDPARYIGSSPLLQADRITTPVLIAHGEFDSMPPAEGERLFSALYRQNRPARLLVFWGEGHNIASPGALRRLQAEMRAWLSAHLGDPPDAP